MQVGTAFDGICTMVNIFSTYKKTGKTPGCEPGDIPGVGSAKYIAFRKNTRKSGSERIADGEIQHEVLMIE
jgi:hypothetical protein